MTAAETFEDLLDQVAARIGDPAPRVYGRLFDESPQLRPLFQADRSGAVRAEMFLRALDTLRDLAAGQAYAPGMVASERVNHGHHGVDAAQFDRFFQIIGEVFREALGADWTPTLDHTWHLLLDRLAAVRGPMAA